MDFRDQTISQLAASLRDGTITASALVEHAFERISSQDSLLHAFTSVDSEQAYQQAARIDQDLTKGRSRGRLAGIPVAVKDLEPAAGFVTSLGSAVLGTDKREASDSVLVDRLKRAGAIVVGKTSTPELGWKGDTDNPTFGRTVNPWGTDRSSGGSSGGSAVAVASGMVPIATGSDGGGSIRIPSAWCGLSGFKPSYGRIPLTAPGDSSAAWHRLSSKGILARRISDISYCLDIVVGPDPSDFESLPMSNSVPRLVDGYSRLPSRVAWCPSLGDAVADPSVLDVCTLALTDLSNAGVYIEEIKNVFRSDLEYSWQTLTTVYNLRTLSPYRNTSAWDLLDEDLATSALRGDSISLEQYLRAEDSCATFHSELSGVFQNYDALLTPTCATSPRTLGAATLRGDGSLDLRSFPYTFPFNLTRSPAATVSVGLDNYGFPVGLQLIGPIHCDYDVLQWANAFELLFGLLDKPSSTNGAVNSKM